MSSALQEGIGLLRQGRAAEAGARFAAVARAEPGNALAHHLMGFVQLQSGELEAGLASLRRSLALNPDNPAALAHLARGLRESGALEEALETCDRAARLAPYDPALMTQRGHILVEMGRLEEGLQTYDYALTLDPRLAEVWRARGVALAKVPRFDLAAASFAKAREFGLDDAALHIDEGGAQWSAGRSAEALACYDRALEIEPDSAPAWGNRGNALRLLERHEEALQSYGRAIALDPAAADFHGNRGVLLADLGRLDEAARDFETCLALDPDAKGMRLRYAFVRLALGDFERGWPLYEARLGGDVAFAGCAAPFWDGQGPLHGKTLLLRSEQGLGDALQFCRYVPRVAAMGARVLLETQAPLVQLFRTLEGVDGLVVLGEPLPEADLQCPLMSLPLHLGTTLDSIPAKVPYLQADPLKVEAWRARLGPGKRLRVGLAWSGGERADPGAAWVNRRRNVPLSLLARLKGLEVDFVSLQKGEPAEGELRELKLSGWDGPDLMELMDDVSDFSDTAALVEALDLVISVDTSVAHLAGALGKPVWLLNRYDSDWRWLAGREDSPWYPSLRIFRQAGSGAWEAVVAQVRKALAALIA